MIAQLVQGLCVGVGVGPEDVGALDVARVGGGAVFVGMVGYLAGGRVDERWVEIETLIAETMAIARVVVVLAASARGEGRGGSGLPD